MDDFHGGEDASMVGDFTNQVFLPAYRELEQRFQVGPLIARMPWHEHLQYYPSPEIQNDWRSRYGLCQVISCLYAGDAKKARVKLCSASLPKNQQEKFFLSRMISPSGSFFFLDSP